MKVQVYHPPTTVRQTVTASYAAQQSILLITLKELAGKTNKSTTQQEYSGNPGKSRWHSTVCMWT